MQNLVSIKLSSTKLTLVGTGRSLEFRLPVKTVYLPKAA
jgi:hypothetical protein